MESEIEKTLDQLTIVLFEKKIKIQKRKKKKKHPEYLSINCQF